MTCIDLTTVMWTLMIYMLSVAVLVPTIGRFAGYPRTEEAFLTGFVLFTLSSLLCDLFQSGGQCR